MLKSLKLPFALIMSLFCFTPLVQADEQLLDGVYPFICDDSAFVFLESDSGWKIPNSHALEVKSTQNGWRVEDTLTGEVWYLRQERSGSWVLNGLYEDGHFTVDCIDLADSIAEVITLIKPRLDLAILDTERALRDTKFKLDNELTKNSQLSAKHMSLLDTLRKTETALEAAKDEYSALRIAAVAAVKGSPGGLFIRDLLEMDPGERNEKINGSNLVQALNRKGILPQCVKTLRDKAKLSDECEEAILEFFLIEGWQLTAADQIPESITNSSLTSGQKSDLIFAVSQCWNVGSLSTEALATTIVVGVQMTEEAIPILSSIRMLSFSGGSERAAQRAFQAARRAIIRCGASGYDLPEDWIDSHKELILTFNPERMRIR